jgi:hypothetical protein
VKNRRLPETDIANWAFLPKSLKEKALVAWLRPRQAKGSYEPYRSTSSDAVNQQLPLYPSGQVLTPWDKLSELVIRKCRGDERLLNMNLPIAKATHAFSERHSVTAQPADIGALTLERGFRYDFGPALILRYDGGASVMFPDLRRTGNLTPHGRLVAQSVMHQRFRVNFPEYAALSLEIWRYKNNDERTIEVFRHSSEPLYSYEQISHDFAETYDMMNSLRAGVEMDVRKSGEGDFGPLFGHL